MDPRCAIAGREAALSDSSGASIEAGWESGLFDRGSWVEAQVRMHALRATADSSALQFQHRRCAWLQQHKAEGKRSLVSEW